MSYDLSGTNTTSKYDLAGVNPPAPSAPPIDLFHPSFSVSESTPSSLPNPNEPFANTNLGITLNTLKGLLTPAPYLKVGKELLQSTARSIGSAGVSVANLIDTKLGGQGIDTLTKDDFQSRLARDVFASVFGNEPVDSLEKRIASLEINIKTSPTAQSLGLSKFSLPLAFGGIIGDATLNLTPFGGEENLVKNLTKDENPATIYKTLIKAGVADDMATKFAPEFAKLNNEAEVKSLFDTVKGLHGSNFISKEISGNPPAFDFTGSGYDFMPQSEKDAILKDIQDSAPKSDVNTLVDDILDGKIKIKVDSDIKREKLDALGGRYQFIFRKDPNLDSMDSVASRVGMSADELLQRITERISERADAKTNITGSRVGKILSPAESALTEAHAANSQELNDVLDTSYGSSIDPETGLVNPPAVRGGLKSPELDFMKWKDKPTFTLARETFARNIEDIATKEDAAKLKEFIVDPIIKNEENLVKFVDALKNKTKAFVSDLGIKAGSKEDRLVQQFGEGLMSITELKDKAPQNWEAISEAANYFRNQYDDLLNKVNTSREAFNYKPIAKRSNYFRHFQEISNVVSNIGLLFKESDLPTEIAGMTDIFKPGKPFTTAELRRKGTESTVSAIKGFDNYIETIGRQIFHIDSVQRVRALEKYIRSAAKEDMADLPAFVANLNEYGNLLSGKAAKLDRAVESVVGRRVFKMANMLKSQTGLSLIAGNISSALTNFIPITQLLSTTEKPSVLKGALDALITPFTQDLTRVGETESGFLLRRFKQGKIAPSITEKGLDMAGWLFKTIDQFTSKMTVASKFYENVGKGVAKDEAMKMADEYAAKVLTDRSFGQLPNLMGSKTAGFLTQFQTEVNNMYSFLVKDIPKMSNGNKGQMVNAFAQFFLYSYIINNIYQEVTGRRPTLDPIYAGLTLLGQTQSSENVKFTHRAQIAGKDIAGNLPFGNLIPGLGSGGRLPVASFFPDFTKLSQGDLTELLNPINLQLKKTIKGATAYQNKKVTTPAGKLKYKIPQTNANFIRTLLFGDSSTPEAQQYYNKLDQNLYGNKKKSYNLSGN